MIGQGPDAQPFGDTSMMRRALQTGQPARSLGTPVSRAVKGS